MLSVPDNFSFGCPATYSSCSKGRYQKSIPPLFKRAVYLFLFKAEIKSEISRNISRRCDCRWGIYSELFITHCNRNFVRACLECGQGRTPYGSAKTDLLLCPSARAGICSHHRKPSVCGSASDAILAVRQEICDARIGRNLQREGSY